MSKLKEFLELADGFIKVLGFVSIAYVISTGFAHRSGANSGEKLFEARRKREGKPSFKTLLSDERHPPFWKDEKLIHGGLKAFQLLASLLSYVLIMTMFVLIFYRPDTARLVMAVALLMFFPNAGAAFFFLLTTISLTTRREVNSTLWVLTALSIFAGVVSVIVGYRDATGYYELAIQGVIFFVQSLIIGYLVGFMEGVREADLEKRLPLVEVTTRTEVINGLRMYRNSRFEYRFINADGSEWLIPATQIKLIRTADSEDNKAAPTS